MSEYKPCPFCGKESEVERELPGCSCFMSTDQTFAEHWNDRPLESAARAEGYREGEREGAVKALDAVLDNLKKQSSCDVMISIGISTAISRVNQLKSAYEKGSNGNGK